MAESKTHSTGQACRPAASSSEASPSGSSLGWWVWGCWLACSASCASSRPARLGSRDASCATACCCSSSRAAALSCWARPAHVGGLSTCSHTVTGRLLRATCEAACSTALAPHKEAGCLPEAAVAGASMSSTRPASRGSCARPLCAWDLASAWPSVVAAARSACTAWQCWPEPGRCSRRQQIQDARLQWLAGPTEKSSRAAHAVVPWREHTWLGCRAYLQQERLRRFIDTLPRGCSSCQRGRVHPAHGRLHPRHRAADTGCLANQLGDTGWPRLCGSRGPADGLQAGTRKLAGAACILHPSGRCRRAARGAVAHVLACLACAQGSCAGPIAPTLMLQAVARGARKAQSWTHSWLAHGGHACTSADSTCLRSLRSRVAACWGVAARLALDRQASTAMAPECRSTSASSGSALARNASSAAAVPWASTSRLCQRSCQPQQKLQLGLR